MLEGDLRVAFKVVNAWSEFQSSSTKDRKIIIPGIKSIPSTSFRWLCLKIICKPLQYFNKYAFSIVFNLPMQCKKPKPSEKISNCLNRYSNDCIAWSTMINN